MTLYVRCMRELTKPDVMKMHKDYLSVLPVPAKAEILSLLCKKGGDIDTSILRPILNSTIVVIDFGECIVTDDVLSCVHSCKFLRKLDLTLRRKQNRFITTEGLVALFPYIKFLEVLDLPYCEEFNDEVVKVLCENCLRIKQLRIPHSSITNNSLHLFGKNLKCLSILNILGTQVSDEGIEYLVTDPVFKTLTEININKCPKVSNAANALIAEKCQNVKIYARGMNTEGTLCFAFKGLFPVGREQNQMPWRG